MIVLMLDSPKSMDFDGNVNVAALKVTGTHSIVIDPDTE